MENHYNSSLIHTKAYTFFCVEFLVCSRKTARCALIDGHADERHMYQRIDEHEDSFLHHSTSDSFMMRSRSRQM